jgi:hypothetical protein
MAGSKKSLPSVRRVYDCGTVLLQVKCPECRAEHRIPYQGVQGFPTNVTLQRFLERHIEITGELPDPTSGQIMERCNVCSDKSYCSVCVHCEKKICSDCKGAHMDILRREIARINNQVSWIFFTTAREIAPINNQVSRIFCVVRLLVIKQVSSELQKVQNFHMEYVSLPFAIWILSQPSEKSSPWGSRTHSLG